MLTKKLKGVYLNSEMKLPNTGGEKTKGLSAQSKDVVSISRETKTDKTKTAEEIGKMLIFRKALEEQASNFEKTYSKNIGVYPEIIELNNLETASNLEIIKQLKGEDGECVSYKNIEISDGESVAISDFKEAVLETLGYASNPQIGSEKARIILDKIGNLFKNGNFFRIVYLRNHPLDEDETIDEIYLVGINNNKQMMGIYFSYDG